VGGWDGATALTSTEFFDPGSSTFLPGPSLAAKRQQLSMVASNANTAFIAGGAVGSSGGTANPTYPTVLEQVTVSP
jgi:hypothetical protein